MENAALIGLSRQIALGRELDVIANNMANVSTNGYKARQSRFKEFLMPGASADCVPAARPARSRTSSTTGTALDLSPGAIERTGNPLDAAIKGDGVLRGADAGGRALHAQRRLHAERSRPARHQRRPHRAWARAARSRSARRRPASRSAPTAPSRRRKAQRGKLRLVRFADPQTLRNEGSNLFSSTARRPGGRHRRASAGGRDRALQREAGDRDEPAHRREPVLHDHLHHARRGWTSCAAPRSPASPTRTPKGSPPCAPSIPPRPA